MKSIVSAVRVLPQGMDYVILDAVELALKQLGGIESIIERKKTVLVKPNIAKPEPLDYTNPAVTWAIAKLFSEYGCRVLLGEDPAIPTSEKAAYSHYGMENIAKMAGAELVSLRHSEHVIKRVPEGGYFTEIPISKYAAEADLIISAATMKSANITTVTLGMKNMKGVISPKWKRKFHTEGLNRGIVDLNSVLPPVLTVLDCTFGRDMTKKVSYPVGLILAGLDTVATDAVCSSIMGFDAGEVEHLSLANKRGLGNIDLNKIEVVGLELEEFIKELKCVFTFSKPQNPFEIAKASNGKITIVQGNPCSICLNELGNSLAELKDRLNEFEKVTIFVGPNVHPEEYKDAGTKILIGSCLKKYEDDYLYVGGCPPTEDAWIAENCGSLKQVMEGLLDK